MTGAGLSRAHARRMHALKITKDVGDHSGWVRSALGLYTHLRQGEVNAAVLRDLREDIMQKTDDLRAAFTSRVGRLQAGEEIDRAVGILLRDVLEHDEATPEEVFRLTETSRARMLLDTISGHWRQPPDGHEDRISALEQEAMAFNVQDNSGTTWQEMMLGTARALGLTADEIQLIEEVYQGANSGFFGVQEISALAEVQASLGEDEILIEFIIPHHPLHPSYSLWALVIDKTETRLIPLERNPLAGSDGMIGILKTDNNAPIDSSPLGNATGRLRVAIQENQTAAAIESLKDLHKLLLAPILDAVALDSFSRVVIVPHRMLHAVPFAALRDENGVALQDRLSIVNAPSAAAWITLRQRRAWMSDRRFLALANPVLDPASGLLALPDAEREVGDVDRMLSRRGWQTNVWVGDKATKDAFAAGAHGAGIIYLATHGERPDIDALDQHGVILTKSAASDAVLTAQEVRQLDLGAASLVVLSVCDGGLFRFAPGDEPLGLVPALLAAGADNVIGALWPIDDAAGRALMTRTMKTVLDQGPGPALTEASGVFSRNGLMPLRDWAAFVCVGSGQAEF